ncbi:9380_t:CDS:1, partial [Acaulospora colombiana]
RCEPRCDGYFMHVCWILSSVSNRLSKRTQYGPSATIICMIFPVDPHHLSSKHISILLANSFNEKAVYPRNSAPIVLPSV